MQRLSDSRETGRRFFFPVENTQRYISWVRSKFLNQTLSLRQTTVVQTVRSLQSTCQVVVRHGVDIVESLMVGRRDKEEIKGGEERREQAGRVPTVTSPNARHCWLDTKGRAPFGTLSHLNLDICQQ
jgi:hypothetical protein